MVEKNTKNILRRPLAALALASLAGGCTPYAEQSLGAPPDETSEGADSEDAGAGSSEAESDDGGEGGSESGSDSGGQDDLCQRSTDAAFEACAIDEQYREIILQDCRERRELQPADCLDAYDVGLECESDPSAWTCNTDETGFVTASPTGCEAERIAQQSCIWNGEHCDELGGVTTPTGACFIACSSAFDCPLNILDCPAAATVWSTAYCAVKPEYQDEVGCGPEGWRPGSVIGGCELLCGGPEGDDSDCPSGMHCYADSIDEGEFFCSGV